MPAPIITAIVSTYNAERFIRGCLDDLVAQTLFAHMEVLVIDSGSPQDESAICAEYVERFPDQIRLVRTAREPLYAAWNRAIGLARGRYLTSANTDDRHSADFMAVMAQALDDNPAVALGYADQYISHQENETFDACAARQAPLRRWPAFTREDLLLRCITGSQPVWRKSLHAQLGPFDTRYTIAADYDLWLRFAAQHELLHVGRVLGVLYDSPTTISGANNRVTLNHEILALKRAHMKQLPWSEVARTIRKELAASYFGMGYQLVDADKSGKSAAPLLSQAVRLHPLKLRFAKTYLLRCVLGLGRLGN